MADIRLSSCLFCEDIRQEIGNKMTLVGVLGNEWRFWAGGKNVWPLKVDLCIFFQFLSVGDAKQFELNIVTNGAMSRTMKDDLVLPKNDEVCNIAIKFVNMTISEASTIELTFVLWKDETEIRRFEKINSIRITEGKL